MNAFSLSASSFVSVVQCFNWLEGSLSYPQWRVHCRVHNRFGEMVKLKSTRRKSSTSQSRGGHFRENNCEELTLRGDKETMKSCRLFFVCFVCVCVCVRGEGMCVWCVCGVVVWMCLWGWWWRGEYGGGFLFEGGSFLCVCVCVGGGACVRARACSSMCVCFPFFFFFFLLFSSSFFKHTTDYIATFFYIPAIIIPQ